MNKLYYVIQEIKYWSDVWFIEKPKSFYYYNIKNTAKRFVRNLEKSYPEHNFNIGKIIIRKEEFGSYKYTVYKNVLNESNGALNRVTLCYIKRLPRFYWLCDKIIYEA